MPLQDACMDWFLNNLLSQNLAAFNFFVNNIFADIYTIPLIFLWLVCSCHSCQAQLVSGLTCLTPAHTLAATSDPILFILWTIWFLTCHTFSYGSLIYLLYYHLTFSSPPSLYTLFWKPACLHSGWGTPLHFPGGNSISTSLLPSPTHLLPPSVNRPGNCFGGWGFESLETVCVPSTHLLSVSRFQDKFAHGEKKGFL